MTFYLLQSDTDELYCLPLDNVHKLAPNLQANLTARQQKDKEKTTSKKIKKTRSKSSEKIKDLSKSTKGENQNEFEIYILKVFFLIETFK